MTLGEKIKDLREARGWSQHELSRRARVRQALLSELELGKKTDTTGQNLRRLAEALKVSVDYLLGKSNDPNRSPEERLRFAGSASLPVTTSLERTVANAEYTSLPDS